MSETRHDEYHNPDASSWLCKCGHERWNHFENKPHVCDGTGCDCAAFRPEQSTSAAPEPSAPADDAPPAEHPDPDINFAIERAAMDLEGATGIDRAEFRRVVQDVIQEPPLPDRPGGFYPRLEAMTEERNELRVALAAAESRADALARENAQFQDLRCEKCGQDDSIVAACERCGHKQALP